MGPMPSQAYQIYISCCHMTMVCVTDRHRQELYPAACGSTPGVALGAPPRTAMHQQPGAGPLGRRARPGMSLPAGTEAFRGQSAPGRQRGIPLAGQRSATSTTGQNTRRSRQSTPASTGPQAGRQQLAQAMTTSMRGRPIEVIASMHQRCGRTEERSGRTSMAGAML